MAKSDKIFQTNGPSNGILTARFAGAGRGKHRISHQRKAKSSTGEEWKFKVKPTIEPRYIDQEKYTSGDAQVIGANEKIPLSVARDKLPSQSYQGSSNHDSLSVPQHEI